MRMPNLEGTQSHEQLNAGTIRDLPQSHLEGMDISNMGKLSRPEYTKEVGRHVFSDSVENSPGILGAFREMEKNGGKEQFAQHYSDYVSMPSIMRLKNPEMYDFMRDRVFYGKEYKYETKSNEFNMTFPFSPDESRELRKMATANQDFAAKVMGNKMNFLPEESK